MRSHSSMASSPKKSGKFSWTHDRSCGASRCDILTISSASFSGRPSSVLLLYRILPKTWNLSSSRSLEHGPAPPDGGGGAIPPPAPALFSTSPFLFLFLFALTAPTPSSLVSPTRRN